jgi:hypothetical protein
MSLSGRRKQAAPRGRDRSHRPRELMKKGNELIYCTIATVADTRLVRGWAQNSLFLVEPAPETVADIGALLRD